MNKNIVWHNAIINRKEREELNGHKAFCLWLTGLSGSGKSTIASELESRLFKLGVHSYILDGDNIRHGLNKDLGFSPEDRTENIRRIGEVAKLFVDAGIVVITAFISPFRADRLSVRNLFDKGRFIEIFVDCSLETCQMRDPKGLYKKAMANIISDFTGLASPYEIPLNAELTLKNDNNSTIQANVSKIIEFLKEKEYLNFTTRQIVRKSALIKKRKITSKQ
ncbi:MAG: adenylyl-sulfate kinase [Bacteroidota bacterium]|nr:adenylyl-sulfate kinase [Bacteroidota bacterium]MDP4190700.1 adenylyl-sulfate kinase [Bacteroidota bacterium]MDP4196963.1 adenylyl-sulfate kinase [Bacteroidota bacterium]